MPSTATVAQRPRARCAARLPPARSICESSHPPKMSPFGLASAGIAITRTSGNFRGNSTCDPITAPDQGVSTDDILSPWPIAGGDDDNRNRVYIYGVVSGFVQGRQPCSSAPSGAGSSESGSLRPLSQQSPLWSERHPAPRLRNLTGDMGDTGDIQATATRTIPILITRTIL